MVKGALSKQRITDILLQSFKGAFLDGKVIRIPVIEDGSTVEIKVTLTAAKDVLGGEARQVTNANTPIEVDPPTQEEIQMIKKLIEELRL